MPSIPALAKQGELDCRKFEVGLDCNWVPLFLKQKLKRIRFNSNPIRAYEHERDGSRCSPYPADGTDTGIEPKVCVISNPTVQWTNAQPATWMVGRIGWKQWKEGKEEGNGERRGEGRKRERGRGGEGEKKVERGGEGREGGNPDNALSKYFSIIAPWTGTVGQRRCYDHSYSSHQCPLPCSLTNAHK